ncbi:MAG: hypothetical protein KatS3mg029_0177 [Saprospiraceae bacterium]|nr:MAG: hypothetical protein KatS3mg029_0177 [Saprospiraceae bacterium]
MTPQQPLKRHPALQPLSREHHFGLLLCWKIRTGLAKGVVPERIKAYTDWFFEHYLTPHFEAEEKHVFPILGNLDEHPLLRRALREHRRLRSLFQKNEDLPRQLSLIEEELTAHIRFEERQLFPAIEAMATPGQLQLLEEFLSDTAFVEVWDDKFWEK